jgi:hypothetical protein
LEADRIVVSHTVQNKGALAPTRRRRGGASISAMDGLFREGVVPNNDKDVSVL